MDDEEFAQLLAEAMWLKNFEITRLKDAVKLGTLEALAEAFKKV